VTPQLLRIPANLPIENREASLLLVRGQRWGNIMPATNTETTTHQVRFSPLILSDRLITLAKDADRAGYSAAAEKLISLACTVLDHGPLLPH
jgi:hypothetical protein